MSELGGRASGQLLGFGAALDAVRFDAAAADSRAAMRRSRVVQFASARLRLKTTFDCQF